ncbi:hypothetical protein N7471_010170 [Penicillium samsonianum]|uniref:uncharacterized protein n=1 Tax=Penicillium samsonianum TaxID=1882272 RepID=UPI0025491F3A|nr:uncharacterized protein N7471_010170 [Penicillium samsonianum]KAJ6128953.1 hypothetical protein N7471_010170 [Penicillium samsonianum]
MMSPWTERHPFGKINKPQVAHCGPAAGLEHVPASHFRDVTNLDLLACINLRNRAESIESPAKDDIWNLE